MRDLIGDYDSLPDVYTLHDDQRETAAYDVRGIVWSDAGAADPVAAAEWVSGRTPRVHSSPGWSASGDPASAGFGDLLARLAGCPSCHSVRVSLAAGLAQGATPRAAGPRSPSSNGPW